MLYALQSDYFQKSVQLGWSYGTQQNIGMGVLSNLRVSFPPQPEQRRIAAYLDEETEKIDRLVSHIESSIEKLQEYRAALINECVTGQRRIPA